MLAADPTVRDHSQPGVHGDPGGQRSPGRVLLVELPDRPQDLQPGQYRPDGIVLEGPWVAPAHHQPVAVRVVEATTEPTDGVGRHRVVPGEDGMQVLRIELAG